MMDISVLVGKTLKKVSVVGNDEALLFETDDGKKYKLFHEQDCCESVYLESIVGDLEDLVGAPVLLAEEVSNADDPDADDFSSYEVSKWTFYKLATRKGYVDLRWFGTSNGYYSVEVDFKEV